MVQDYGNRSANIRLFKQAVGAVSLYVYTKIFLRESQREEYKSMPQGGRMAALPGPQVEATTNLNYNDI